MYTTWPILADVIPWEFVVKSCRGERARPFWQKSRGPIKSAGRSDSISASEKGKEGGIIKSRAN